MVKVAVVMLTLNEEEYIEDALKQFRSYVDYILVIDGGSTDKTVHLAKEYADKVITKSFSGSFAKEKNYARTKVPTNCSWILWADADERWDMGFIRSIKEYIESAGQVTAFRFPRINLPDAKDYPDYQIRLFPNSRDIIWKGKIHEIPWLVPENIPVDRADSIYRKKIIPLQAADMFPIIHLERREDQKREWW